MAINQLQYLKEYFKLIPAAFHERCKGSHRSPKRMNFRKTSILVMIFRKEIKKRGEVISDLKNFIVNLVRFGPVCEKIAIYFPKKGGRGQRPFGNFPKIHPLCIYLRCVYLYIFVYLYIMDICI